MIFNTNDDFSDETIFEQIFTHNIDTMKVQGEISETKYFLGIEFIKKVNINTDHVVILSDSLF